MTEDEKHHYRIIRRNQESYWTEGDLTYQMDLDDNIEHEIEIIEEKKLNALKN